MTGLGATRHIFTVEVECEDSDEYEQAVRALSSVGEILDEQMFDL